MPLNFLSIRNFRNLKDVVWEIGPGLNVLEGENAQGKTNLLEAIYVLAHGRSFRTSETESLLKHDENNAQLEAKFLQGELESQLHLRMNPEGKELRYQGKLQRNWSKVYENFRVLIFTPDSTALYRTAPASRRRYFDQAIAVHYLHYGPLLNRYARVLRQRNQMLEENAPADLREPFDRQWAELSLQILSARREYLEELLPKWRQRIETLTHTHPSFGARWEGALSQVEDWTVEGFLGKLAETRNDEIRRRMTLLGPNREDLGVYFGNQEVRQVASQGQQRLLTIALKLAEADLFVARNGKTPVFLLDDIGSELDSLHLNRLLEVLSQLHSQTILTTTQAGAFSPLGAQTHRVVQGQIHPVKTA